MSYSGHQYSATASASAGAGYGTQVSLSVPTQITTTPLTTIFTPPPECRTPFLFVDHCYSGSKCYGSYMPFLYIPNPSATGGLSIQCLPQTTLFSNGYLDGIFDYNPGLFCPDGMTTDTSIGSAFLCCPSGLTYSYDGYAEECTATLTEGSFFAGASDENQGIVYSTTEGMTLFVAARPVYLTQGSDVASQAFGDNSTPSTTTIKETSDATTKPTPGVTSSVVTTSRATICRRHSCQTTTPTNPVSPDPSGSSSHIGLKVGASIGGVIVLALIVLGYILLTRRRRKQLPNGPQPLNSPPTDSEVEAVRQIYRKKHLPELPVPESRVELEGTPVEGRGAGIYVLKPELEGTAGTPGALGVYIMNKSELEAKHNGTTSSAPGAGARTTTTTPYESPIIGPSFTRYSVTTSGAG